MFLQRQPDFPRSSQHRVFYPDGHPSRYQPCPTELNFGEQTGTGVFPVVIAVSQSQSHEDSGNIVSASPPSKNRVTKPLQDNTMSPVPICT